ncbi:MAG TPA: VOC family protein [Chloroflexi bacterium]|jgi:glyoxylase I family protein|nr:VOC family protein [Chloroflexota bacterium]
MAIIKSHHIALRSTRFEETKAFYTEVLGLPIRGQIPNSKIVFIDLGGTTIELIPTDAEATDRPAAGFVHLAFQVYDVDATYNELVAKGVEFHVAPRDAGDIRLAFFKDPDGNELELFCSPSLTW